MQALFRHTLLFDGHCPLCLASVERLREMDGDRRLEYLPNQDPTVRDRFPNLSPEMLNGSLHLVDSEGEVWEGAEALEQIVLLLPRYAWLGRLFSLPLVRPLARIAYRFVARNRYRLNCGDHCSPSLPDV
jgi:predicted DCC family thiol-disulfide oxidoreductase YuxK